ncbi:uncharacterized protein LOC107041471 [Diachasma alloeum]|uniref:Odorant receptor n=1 Tax=Diachasma alloeum TaxID=454923 RepID=A0A4E0RMX2_9HYME|nr:uncharacterized protein LOC107041471 [Diachasma alloeum]THK33118.1 odorant receptor 197 [Diachasma alloeum]
MMPDTELDEKFRQAKKVWHSVNLSLVWMGMWPVNVTTSGRIKLTAYLTYWIIKLSLEITELFMVIGSLDTVIDNFAVTGVELVGFSRVITWRFSPVIYKVINEIQQFREYANFKDSVEMEIFIRHSQSSQRFHRFLIWPMCVCTLSWYFTPLMDYLSASMHNETIPLQPPYRFPPIIDISQGYLAIIVYLFDFPLMYTGLCGTSTYSTHFLLINEICAQLAILAHRIRNFEPEKCTNISEAVGHIVDKHVMLIRVTKNLNDSTTIYLVIELLNTTVLIALCSYNVLINLEDTFLVGLITFASFLLALMIMIYTDCYMGECLQTEAMNLFQAFRECDIHKWPISWRKALIICTLRAHIPLEMTAGKFFKFTLSGFINILRSSMAYISMLRAML